MSESRGGARVQDLIQRDAERISRSVPAPSREHDDCSVDKKAPPMAGANGPSVCPIPKRARTAPAPRAGDAEQPRARSALRKNACMADGRSPERGADHGSDQRSGNRKLSHTSAQWVSLGREALARVRHGSVISPKARDAKNGTSSQQGDPHMARLAHWKRSG